MTSFFLQTWLQQVDSKLRPQIRVGASAIFWSIWLTRNDVIFDKKNILLLFTGYFQGDSLDAILVHTSKEGRPTKFEKGMPSDGDCSNRNFCQEWMIAF
jgi:hypothetical protein